jgi:lysozyme family protein
MTAFDKWVKQLMGVEGFFSRNPRDRGGATKYGITEKVAREEGFAGAMEDLSSDVAIAIYKRRYWDSLRLDDVALVSERAAREIADTCVNTGTRGQYLQRSLNVLNRQQKDYPDLKVDGNVGPATLSALHSFSAVRGVDGEAVLLAALNALQGVHYIELAEADPVQEDFEYGWFLNRVVKEA